MIFLHIPIRSNCFSFSSSFIWFDLNPCVKCKDSEFHWDGNTTELGGNCFCILKVKPRKKNITVVHVFTDCKEALMSKRPPHWGLHGADRQSSSSQVEDTRAGGARGDSAVHISRTPPPRSRAGEMRLQQVGRVWRVSLISHHSTTSANEKWWRARSPL